VCVTTAGVGLVPAGVELGPSQVEVGDRVLVSGTLGDHGMAVMIAAAELELETDLESDSAPSTSSRRISSVSVQLYAGCATRLAAASQRLSTRLAQQAGVAIVLEETALAAPGRRRSLRDPRHRPALRRERRKLIAVVAAEASDEAIALRARRSAPRPQSWARCRGATRLRALETALGGSQIVDVLVGDPLPRIC
jgi:hydrogenase expression/formation protein HypE